MHNWKTLRKLQIINLLILILITSNFYINGESPNNLPKTEILGKEYYIYEAKKGESIYGVAKRYNWNLEELVRLNPESNGNLQKGTRLYYPTGQVTIVTEIPEETEIDFSKLEPINHKVKKGETIYSISRQYGISLETIYKYNPTTKKGVKAGDIIEIPQNGTGTYYFYTVKKDDTLSKISQEFNTSVEDILKNNAGLTVTNMKPGETIRVSINSNVGKIKTELVAEEQVKSITSYKVSKNDTWDEISEKTGVTTEVLKEANKMENDPKENTIINVPQIETVEVEKELAFENPETMSYEEVKELYDSIRGNANDDIIFEGVRLALILDDPNSKKDVDFTRGVLIALSEMTNIPFKVDLKVLDGRVSTNNLTDELDNYEPNLIISTADKTFPLFLADYGNSNHVQIINAFDLKNDLFEDNSSMIQILPPSSFFNDRISSHIYKENKRRKLYIIGDEDDHDGIASELKNLYEGDTYIITLEEFGNLEPDIINPILIYSCATKKEEVADFMTNVDNLTENNPGIDFKIIGRSNWIAMVDDYGDKFSEYSIIVPSRVWLGEESKTWKNFERTYENMFEGTPVRSIPNFAASGYDIANYFIPAVKATKADFNNSLPISQEGALQTDFNLYRVNNWGGFINGVGYLITFQPDDSPEKILVK